MLALFKRKKKQPSYESIAKAVFTQGNLFVDYLEDIRRWNPDKRTLLRWLKEAEEDPNYSQKFYLNFIKNNTEVFFLNHQTKDYVKTLLRVDELIRKCSSIIRSSKKNADYLLNELVGAVYLLQELDSSLRRGVPLSYKGVSDGVYALHQLLDEKLNGYFEWSTKSLTEEIQIAKQLRVEYQARKDALNLMK